MIAYYIDLCNCEAMTKRSLTISPFATGSLCTPEAATQAGCRPRPPLTERPLLAVPDAGALERTFKVLASGTRLRLLHALVLHPGLAVTELADTLGMTPHAVSNQLQRLADKGIVSGLRDGVSIHYRVVDPCVVALLDQCLCLTEDARDRQARLAAPSVAVAPPRGRERLSNA